MAKEDASFICKDVAGDDTREYGNVEGGSVQTTVSDELVPEEVRSSSGDLRIRYAMHLVNKADTESQKMQRFETLWIFAQGVISCVLLDDIHQTGDCHGASNVNRRL